MHENECNLAGDTMTLHDDISGVIHCIRFILLTFMMIKTKACHRHKIISGGCYKLDGTPPNPSTIDVMVGSPSKKQTRARDMLQSLGNLFLVRLVIYYEFERV